MIKPNCFSLLVLLSVLLQGCNTSTPEDEVTNNCSNDNTISTSNLDCPFPVPENGQYQESIVGQVRRISSNNVPNHIYGDIREQFTPFQRTFTIDSRPVLATETTSILTNNNRPLFYFGVALNGVIFAPAPATPFIFENTQTGEYNWDWVFEPTMNIGSGDNQVQLDCANAHIGPQGYHYHGNMVAYTETLDMGISNGVVPDTPIQVGWAADGFPVIYMYGPDSSGTLVELNSSYRLKSGNRPGDGITEPCGLYNGKYTRDYEYVPNLGDLDECNGINRNITLTTPSGDETFSYFYVITESFPQISRCFKGNPDSSFQ